MTKEEEAEFDLWADRKRESQEELEHMYIDLKASIDPMIKTVIKQEIERTEKMFGNFKKLLPGV